MPVLLETYQLAILLCHPVGECGECLLWVTGGKTPSEDMFSELPQVADIAGARSPLGEVLRIADHRVRGPSDARLSSNPIISLRLSRIDWLCSASRASVWVTDGTRCRVN